MFAGSKGRGRQGLVQIRSILGCLHLNLLAKLTLISDDTSYLLHRGVNCPVYVTLIRVFHEFGEHGDVSFVMFGVEEMSCFVQRNPDEFHHRGSLAELISNASLIIDRVEEQRMTMPAVTVLDAHALAADPIAERETSGPKAIVAEAFDERANGMLTGSIPGGE